MKMSELSCFRKAAELGCEDFRIETQTPDDVSFVQDENAIKGSGTEYQSVKYTIWPRMNPRIARAAAARCVEWWKRTARRDKIRHLDLAKEMIRQARGFGRKVGVECSAKRSAKSAVSEPQEAETGKNRNAGKWDDANE